MDRAVITCERFGDLPRLRALAESHGTGLDLQEFAYPDILDGDWRAHVIKYRKALAGFPGELVLHGAFFDLFCGSPDRKVTAIARERFRQNLTIAAELGAHLVNFHINFLPLIDDPHYLPGWTERQIAFWQPLTQEAAALGVTVTLENMWEPDPAIHRRILDTVHSPNLRACLDVGHARIYSTLPFETWLETFKPYLALTHLHNTNGETDIHLSFDAGLLDMNAILDQFRALARPPIFCLEIDKASIEASLKYIQTEKGQAD